MTLAARPDHVPEALFWPHDIESFAAEGEDPFLSLARLHDGPDIVWSPDIGRGRAGWILTRFDALQDAYRNPNLFSRAETSELSRMVGEDWRLNPLEIEPPHHAAYRQVLQPAFQPRAIAALDDKVRAIAGELIDRFEDRDGCEFVADFASQFPSYVFMALMGLPRDDLPQLLEWENAFMRGPDFEARAAAARRIVGYLKRQMAEREETPRDDLISTILAARIDGRPLDYNERMGMCFVLYAGGLDTVASSLGWHLRHLARDPDLQRRLQENPADIAAAADELLRAFGVVASHRYVTADVDFHGVAMKRGDFVVMSTHLAGRDPRRYADPHRIDIDRHDLHLTLGAGVHNCLGMHLARREIRIVLEEFTRRFSNIRIPDGAPVDWHTRNILGVKHMPLEWKRAS